jgi:hypothetical protein
VAIDLASTDCNRPQAMFTFVISTGLLAAQHKGLQDERLLWATGILVATLLAGAVVLALIDRWRKKQLSDPTGERDPLTTYRELYQRGELSKEEYVKIRDKLAASYMSTGERPPSDGDDGSSPGPNTSTAPEA